MLAIRWANTSDTGGCEWKVLRVFLCACVYLRNNHHSPHLQGKITCRFLYGRPGAGLRSGGGHKSWLYTITGYTFQFTPEVQPRTRGSHVPEACSGKVWCRRQAASPFPPPSHFSAETAPTDRCWRLLPSQRRSTAQCCCNGMEIIIQHAQKTNKTKNPAKAGKV